MIVCNLLKCAWSFNLLHHHHHHHHWLLVGIWNVKLLFYPHIASSLEPLLERLLSHCADVYSFPRLCKQSGNCHRNEAGVTLWAKRSERGRARAEIRDWERVAALALRAIMEGYLRFVSASLLLERMFMHSSVCARVFGCCG